MGALPQQGPSSSLRRVVILNPLGGALHHYSARLSETLASLGLDGELLTIFEPSARGRSRFRWLTQYLLALFEARRLTRRGDRVLVTWPVLGHLDRLLARVIVGGRNCVIVMHDPDPLVAAVGYGSTAISLAARLAPGADLLVHSPIARDELADQGLRSTLVAHPLIATQDPAQRPDHPVVRVLGQWKPDRYTELLTRLGPLLEGIDLEVIGRGWPAIPHWSVRNEFVTEEELDTLITTSSAVLIPYRRFYQSGIAARALETAVPVVGPRRELTAMAGAHYPFLVEDVDSVDEWLAAIRTALSSDTEALVEARNETSRQTLDSWQKWMQA